MHFDDQNESGAMYDFYKALEGNNSDEFIGKKCAAIINTVIGLNIFIYNPEHGIYKQFDKNEAPENVLREDQSIDLSPRTCTIKIDDAKFSNIENLRWFTLGNLGRELLFYRSILYRIDDMDIFKKYATDKTYYTLDELYTKRYEGTDIPLIDYGLNLIFEQCYSVLIEKAKEAKASSDNSAHNKIEKEIKKIFTKQEDLNIAVSIYDNIGPIMKEKDIHSCMIKVLEYILNLENFLEEKNGTKILKINGDLSNFCEDYIVKTELEKIVDDEKRSIRRKKKENSESSRIKNKELSAKEAELEEWKKTADPNSQDYEQIEKEKMEGIERVRHDINCLANDRELLKWKEKRETFQAGNISVVKGSFKRLLEVSPDQKSYLLMKIKELVEARGVKVVVDGVEEALKELKISKPTEVDKTAEEHQVVEMEVDGAPQ
ncbi:hypothetical protein NEMIN01_2479, partial [Nematocida minor]|uniref:uncharacterized protein n=1 Tax=Nematocida minor TaxID=1912983 RepID=UPI0022207535